MHGLAGAGGHLRTIGEKLQPEDGKDEDKDESYELHTTTLRFNESANANQTRMKYAKPASGLARTLRTPRTAVCEIRLGPAG